MAGSRINHTCERCGESFSDWRSRGHRRFCSKACQWGTPRERWESFVPQRPEGGCWEWSGARDWDGYGMLQVDGSPRRAARLAYAFFVAPIPEGMWVRHRCDNPPCVNPAHLVLGTPVQNSRDMVDRVRQARGSRNGFAKLTEGQVVLIREAHAAGASIAQLARAHEITESGVRLTVQGKAWRHVGGPVAAERGSTAGERNGRARLTAEQVAGIRARLTGRRGEQAAIAREHGVSPATISLIARGVNWPNQ